MVVTKGWATFTLVSGSTTTWDFVVKPKNKPAGQKSFTVRNKYPEYETAATPLLKDWNFKLKVES